MSKRIQVFKDKSEEDGFVVQIESPEDFVKKVKEHFKIDDDKKFVCYLKNCEVVDLRVLRNDDKVHLSRYDPNEPSSSEKREWIVLNVGGTLFTTTRSTILAKEPGSMLARMFANEKLISPSCRDKNGAYMIDRCPTYFEPILNYLRNGTVVIDDNINPRGVLAEAIFFGIDSMIPILQDMISESKDYAASPPLRRSDVVNALMKTSTKSELRFQGINFSGANLSRLDLRHINFKYANLSECNLSGANLSFCSLERADLSHANLEGAQLLGVKALCANMEGANLKGCNMEDPTGSRAVLESVNLKNAILEGSNLGGVILRVATLKHANLKNCDLRAAVLAGADLECCDLSGSDLHEANLRGANLKDAAFELMQTPLHMSQTVR